MRLLLLLLSAALSLTAATSYANAGGTGNRQTSITIYADPSTFNDDDWPLMVNGAQENTVYIPNGTGFHGKAITFDFRTGKIVDEIRVDILNVKDQGTWQVSGSNDGTNFTNIGSPVAFTVAAPAVLAFTNATSYRYYRITGSSGTMDQDYWREVEFKIEAGSATYASTTSYSHALGSGNRTASITITATAGLFTNTTYDIFVNGATSEFVNYVPNGTGFQGKSVVFDFGASVVVDEVRLYCPGNKDQAAWQVAGSSDNSAWTDLGTPKAYPVSVGQTYRVIPFFNLTGYRYYRLTGSSGTVNQDWYQEFDFRAADAPVGGVTAVSALGLSVVSASSAASVQ